MNEYRNQTKLFDMVKHTVDSYRITGGYPQITHEIYRALYGAEDLGKRELKVMMYLVHQTFFIGGKRRILKKQDKYASQAVIAEETNLDKGAVSATLDSLETKLYISICNGDLSINIGRILDPDTWRNIAGSTTKCC